MPITFFSYIIYDISIFVNTNLFSILRPAEPSSVLRCRFGRAWVMVRVGGALRACGGEGARE